MAKKKHGEGVGSGRFMWAAGGSRLWDRDGLEWEDADKEVDRAEAKRMLRAADLPVVISMGAGPLRWIDDVGERMAVWRSEIAPNFHDGIGWKPPVGAPANSSSTRRRGSAATVAYSSLRTLTKERPEVRLGVRRTAGRNQAPHGAGVHGSFLRAGLDGARPNRSAFFS